MIKPSDIISLGVGFAVGDGITDALDIDNPIESIATGFVTGGIATSVTSNILKETGIGDLLDDFF